ncbi:MAG: serine hydrolase domain-containing protein [Anaerolineaceae bacterium]|nr:serine hydrolase domain-containing protein [Anaerolineaceae bacterium]
MAFSLARKLHRNAAGTWRWLAWLFGVCIVACSLGGCRAGPSVQAGDLASLTAALEARLPGLLARYSVPGASLALVVDGELAWSRGFGWADPGQDIPAGPETVYQVASISKPVTAWGVMRLVAEGQLDLDAPAGRYLTRWALPPSPYDPQAVTLRRLLSHSAGLSVHGYPGLPLGQALPSLEESLSGAGGAAYAVQPVAPAGQQFSYSGGGYTLLQLIVEEVSGQDFAAWMQAEVLGPLGLQHSSFQWRADLRPATAVGHDRRGRALPNYLFTEKAAAGLYTTAEDLARFGAAALPGAQGQPAGRGVLSPSAVAALLAPAAAMPPGSVETYLSGMDAYGLGYFIETLPDGSRWVSHNGGNRGWRSLLVLAPERRAVLVVLTNGDGGDVIAGEATALWAEWLGCGLPRRLQRAQSIATVVLAAGSLLLMGWVLWINRFARDLARGKRRFSRRLGWKGGLRLLLAVLLAGLWWAGGRQLVEALLPRLVAGVEWVFLLWTVALALGALAAPHQARGV